MLTYLFYCFIYEGIMFDNVWVLYFLEKKIKIKLPFFSFKDTLFFHKYEMSCLIGFVYFIIKQTGMKKKCASWRCVELWQPTRGNLCKWWTTRALTPLFLKHWSVFNRSYSRLFLRVLCQIPMENYHLMLPNLFQFFFFFRFPPTEAEWVWTYTAEPE